MTVVDRPRDLRSLSQDRLIDEMMALFCDPTVRKVVLYLRLKEELESRRHRFVRDWMTEPSSSSDATD